jgi:glycosyltransferase involved in cell wall biosynthesis
MDQPETPQHIPAVCVITPAYNQASYLTQAVQSVLGQTCQDFELIVVDDGSTDDTPQVLAGIHDPRVKVIRQPNAGLSAARNTGLRACRAPYVTFLDADDFFMPDKLAVLSAYLEQHPEVGLVGGGTQVVDQTGHPLRQTVKSPGKLGLFELLAGNPFTVTSVMVRKEWIDRVGTFDETLRACEDWDMWLRLAYAGCRFEWVEHVVGAYRYHVSQMTRQSERMRTAFLAVLKKFYSQPGLPTRVIAYKDKAYASALVATAAYAYHANELGRGKDDLIEALRLDPTLRDNGYQRLVNRLVGWSDDPRSTRPAAFLQGIIGSLPPEQGALKGQLKQAMADVLLGELFAGSRETWRVRKGDLLKVILNKPKWLFNRGVLRMMVYAWLRR